MTRIFVAASHKPLAYFLIPEGAIKNTLLDYDRKFYAFLTLLNITKIQFKFFILKPTSPAQNPVTATVFLEEILVDRFKNERLHLALTQPDSTTANLTSCTVKNGDRLEVLSDAVLGNLSER